MKLKRGTRRRFFVVQVGMRTLAAVLESTYGVSEKDTEYSTGIFTGIYLGELQDP